MCDIDFFQTADDDHVEVIINSIVLLDDDHVECKPINGLKSYKLHKSLLPFKTIGEFKQFKLHINDEEAPLDAENVKCQILTYNEFKSNWDIFHPANKYPPNFKLIPNYNGLLEHIFYAYNYKLTAVAINYHKSKLEDCFAHNSVVPMGNPIKEIVAWHTITYNQQSNCDEDKQRPILHIIDKNLNIDDYFWLNNDIRNFVI